MNDAAQKLERETTAAAYAINSRSDALKTRGLCGHCCNGIVYRRRAPRNVELEETSFCRLSEHVVPNDIAECSAFCDSTRMHLDAMRDIALLVDTRPDLGGYK